MVRVFRTGGELVDYLNEQISIHGREIPVLHKGEWGGEIYPVIIREITVNDVPELLFVEDGDPIGRW